MKKIVAALVVVAWSVAGCSKAPIGKVANVSENPPAESESAPTSNEDKDFRGFTWGDTMDVVAEQEKKRSKFTAEVGQYETTLAGYPVLLSYGSQGPYLAGGTYAFPWPGETGSCKGLLAAGSECSLKSAAYAIEVCDRIGTLLSEKYHELGATEGWAPPRIVKDPTELDRELAFADSGMDVAARQWTGPRSSPMQFFKRGRNDGQGWRCTIVYRPTPELDQTLLEKATQQENEAAKKDL